MFTYVHVYAYLVSNAGCILAGKNGGKQLEHVIDEVKFIYGGKQSGLLTYAAHDEF